MSAVSRNVKMSAVSIFFSIPRRRVRSQNAMTALFSSGASAPQQVHLAGLRPQHGRQLALEPCLLVAAGGFALLFLAPTLLLRWRLFWRALRLRRRSARRLRALRELFRKRDTPALRRSFTALAVSSCDAATASRNLFREMLSILANDTTLHVVVGMRAGERVLN